MKNYSRFLFPTVLSLFVLASPVRAMEEETPRKYLLRNDSSAESESKSEEDDSQDEDYSLKPVPKTKKSTRKRKRQDGPKAPPARRVQRTKAASFPEPENGETITTPMIVPLPSSETETSPTPESKSPLPDDALPIEEILTGTPWDSWEPYSSLAELSFWESIQNGDYDRNSDDF